MSRLLRFHAEMSTDIKQCDVDRIALANRLHIFEICSVAGVINRWPILDRDNKTSRVPAVRALGFIWTSFRIEDAARMNRGRHCDCYLTVGDLNLAANSHERIGFS